MNDWELEVLLNDLESDRVERASISDKGKLLKQFVPLPMTYQTIKNQESYLLA